MQERMNKRQLTNKKINREKKVKIKEELPSNALTSTITNATSSGTDTTMKNTIATTTSITKQTSLNTEVNKKVTLKKRPIVMGSLKTDIDGNQCGKKIKADYSVAKDPNASDVYKSLFTSHKSEKEQGRAHWITYNPFYN